ncbi:hypothetical protein BSL78_13264 [Apostichopus japonicus]|uniref:Ig-like domain-containing protein n=1 Tax=Stichopus japonicus TaxID=307972 RepID=A0A2G8KPC2_STIJA|nr:hypothetical protein BSL78_13264 [Apostichopus japonicus]
MPLPLQSQRMALLQMILTVFISLMKITSARSLLVKPVAYGTKFSLNCQTVQNFNETLQELYWFKDGSMLLNASGINTYSVDNATFTDSGNYSCRTAGSTEYLQRTKVIVGRKPASPSPSVCFGSKSPMVTCTFYSGSQDEIKLCWEIANTNRYVWISGCEDYNVQQKNVTFLLEEPRLLLTTTVKNEFGNSNRTDRHEPIVKPDPPIIKRLFTTSIDTLNASFTIPRTWSTESWLNYKGNYTQNGIEGKLLEDFTRRKKEVFFSFTVERLPYSLVCLTMQIQNGILTPYMQVDSLPWSNFSKPMCSYTPMAAPSKSPIIYRVSVNQSQSESELRNITLSWHPPPPENRNGIIDHYELLTILHNKTILKYELPGNATNTKVVGKSNPVVVISFTAIVCDDMFYGNSPYPL